MLHGITYDTAARGEPPRTVLGELLGELAGKVLVAHNATFELRFLGVACLALWGSRIVVTAAELFLAQGQEDAAGSGLRQILLAQWGGPRRRSAPVPHIDAATVDPIKNARPGA